MTPVIFMKYFRHWSVLNLRAWIQKLGLSFLELNRLFDLSLLLLTLGLTSPATLYDRYSSPTASSTRRRLFVENDNPSDGGTPGRIPPQPLVNAVPVQNVSGDAVPVTPVPGQTLVTMATATVTANNGQTVTIPVQGKEVGYWVLSWWHLLESHLRFGWNDNMREEWSGEGGWEGGNWKPMPGEPFILLIFSLTNCRYCEWKWRDNILPSPGQCHRAGTSCDWLHPAPECSGPGWKFELSTGDRNNLASPWSGGHSTDFPRWTPAETRPTFNWQQY